MSNNIRDALKRLIELDNNSPSGSDIGYDPQWLTDWYKAIAKARDALAAQPVGDGPSEEQILSLANDCLGFVLSPEEKEDIIELVRATLARWVRPATPTSPEDGGASWAR